MSKCLYENIPSRELAEAMLKEAEPLNPGPWVDHSIQTALCAQIIAKNCKMDDEVAYILGLLHDIGRREGVKKIKHIFDGYYYLSSFGYTDAAKICLTHSFNIKDPQTFVGEGLDCTNEELEFLNDFLSTYTYTDYDKLIQLCDALAYPSGPVLIEKRLGDVGMRYGFNKFSRPKWLATFDLKAHFDNVAGCNIYTLFPNIKQNTFGF